MLPALEFIEDFSLPSAVGTSTARNLKIFGNFSEENPYCARETDAYPVCGHPNFVSPAEMNEGFRRQTGPKPRPLKGHGELILLVDDEASVLRVTAMVLHQQNYSVLCADNGSKALDLFTQHSDSIKAVLTDINLPIIDGVALIRAIKEIKPDMVCIASSGQSDDLHTGELQRLGVTNLLTKPYDKTCLLTTLRNALENSV
jgi:CheY-like chemotaxis protein